MLCRPSKRLLSRLLALVLLTGATPLPAAPHLPPNHFVRVWQVEQGLPQNKVTTVVQTRDGYLWVGTYNGLARFDGNRFTVFDDNNTPELRSRRVTSLFEAEDGTLWIGTENGQVSKYKEGRFHPVQFQSDWHGGKIYKITADNVGDVWLLNETGELSRIRDGKYISPPAGPISQVVSFARGTDGTVWVNREGIVSALRNGQLTNDLATNHLVHGICAARDGGFWVASQGNLRRWKNGEWLADPVPSPWNWSIVPNLIETSSGAIVAGASDSGLWFVFPYQTNRAALRRDSTTGLPSDWVISLFEDKEKNLWCGTGAGLVLIRPSHLTTVSPPDNWKKRPLLSVLPTQDGTLWFGTEGAGVYRLREGVWSNFMVTEGLRNLYIWGLAADRSGRIWAGSWGGGLFVQNGDTFDYPPGLEEFRAAIPALFFSDEDLWIGTTEGALLYRDGKLERLPEISNDVRAIARDNSGTMWFGTAGAGLVRWQNGQARRFRKADGLPSDFIECIHFAADGALWAGTFGGGLVRLKDGEFNAVNREHGLPSEVIGHIEADGLGYLWMSSYGGIIRAREENLNRCADGQIAELPLTVYGVNDGLPTLECSEGLQPAGGRTADGRLWFPMAKGLAVVDPGGVSINPLPPPVRIEEMRVDDKPFGDAAAGNTLKVPPGRHRIEFEYTALSFVAPEKVRFKCRLNKLETVWTDVGGKRVATYNYIPPGSYSFQVIACNNDGIWNQTGATLSFEVLPYFWQTTWFRIFVGIATVLAASGAVWFETRRRMRRRLERAERQRDIERERSRIARDIHDDLGAHLTRITMMSESARNEVANTDRTVARLEKIYNTARELTHSMDEIVWAVNPRHDTLEGLATYLEKFAQDLLATAGIRCRLDLPLQFPDWHLTSELRHNVFLALKEALHNAVKHSRATEVIISLALGERSFQLTVKDNGVGFPVDPAGATSGSPVGSGSRNGLANMSRRLTEIGGRFEIHSQPGSGTEAVLHVPIKG